MIVTFLGDRGNAFVRDTQVTWAGGNTVAPTFEDACRLAANAAQFGQPWVKDADSCDHRGAPVSVRDDVGRNDGHGRTPRLVTGA